MHALPPSLAPLASLPQFVCWFAAPKPGNPQKFDKFPVNPTTGQVCDAQAAANWTDAATALAMAQAWDRGHGSGVGFVFTEADPYAFLDIDGCLLPPLPDGTPAQWSPLALELCDRLPGAAVEISHSGTGLHVFGRYASMGPHACKNIPLGLELYHAGRFVALTGTGAQGSVDADITASLALLTPQYFSPQAGSDTSADWTSEPVAEWRGPADDAELVEMACRSGQRSAAAAFGGGDAVTFKTLWEADPAALGKRWPSDKGDAFDHSAADQTLANHLAFWTGKDCERIERLMRQSALARPKWDIHRSYMGRTIIRACGFVGAVATGRREPEAVHVPPDEPEALQAATAATGRALRPGAEYMGPLEQLTHFTGLYFLADQARIYDLRRNAVMAKATFDVVYGGHMFVLDPIGAKTTPSAWDGYTLNRVNAPVVVEDLCFRPELAPGAVITEGGRKLVNSYVPYDPPSAPGDVEPWLALLRLQLPDENDRAVLLNYMAHCAQRPGVKSQWWPVLQGTKGNGKTAHAAVLRYISGEHYTHLPNAHAIARDGMKFNSWVSRKTMIIIEEIKLADKRDFLEEFKIIITADRISMEGKGTNAVTGDNRANGILCTNFRDGVPIDPDERRYAILYMAQQSIDDLIRDGMGPDDAFWPDWWAWFRGGGAAAIAHYLRTYPIAAALDPAGAAHRAPRTSSTALAIQHSFGRAEQEIQNAIGEGLPGFAGGWVSSFYLEQLLSRIRAPVPRNRRREMMRTLGYDIHPALTDGRTNAPVAPDNVKSVLYCRRDHIALHLTAPADVAAAYSRAQQPGVSETPAAVVQAFGR